MRYLLAFVVFVNTCQAAPIPKSAPPVCVLEEPDEMIPLVGTWTLDWWGMKGGIIRFYSNGYFWYQHDRTGQGFWHGTWQLKDNVLTMHEWYVNGAGVRAWSSTFDRSFRIGVDSDTGGYILEKGVFIHTQNP